ncbi:MAG: DNA cytosine methyltransferase [Rhodothermaceae bacterium]|nr:DNA cytosine methyltransferase [Rhodothermaceae bacterium]MXX96782.1 DNA cytosine methyltransferase [Rhodothermaceae bacterium]MXZ57479.1 DNA cytosine methyltransferase [Rhodothermaceae bacterium]MYB90463.1 DNA cytosine methyltransferase [Rhodothermaceae bacterium]MYC04733.1 DNA cytosine methyltransferase [Rhodothermaceae bacterium]
MTNSNGGAVIECCKGFLSSPTYIDVFSGCGGLSLGLARGNWRGLLAVEKDPWAFNTYKHNLIEGKYRNSFDWPDGIELKPWDIQKLLDTHTHELSQMAGAVDLVVGGPPCQGYSMAGRRNQADPRNRLYEAYIQLLHLVQPSLICFENVTGFTNNFPVDAEESIRNFATELERKLENKYTINSTIINTRDFGVPQARKRYILVGANKDMQSASRIHDFFLELSQNVEIFLNSKGLPHCPTVKDAIGDLELSGNGKSPSIQFPGFDSIRYKSPQTSYQIGMHDGLDGTPSDLRLPRHRKHIIERFESIISHCREDGCPGVTVPEKIREMHGLKKHTVRILKSQGVAPTLTSLPEDLLHYSEPRILTVREYARLQSFPDWFSFKGNYTTGGHKRSQETPRYTQVADAVPPLVSEQIGIILLSILTNVPPRKLLEEIIAD